MRQTVFVIPGKKKKAPCGFITLKTTLYDLVEAVREEVRPGEEQLVSEIVFHLIESRKSNIQFH